MKLFTQWCIGDKQNILLYRFEPKDSENERRCTMLTQIMSSFCIVRQVCKIRTCFLRIKLYLTFMVRFRIKYFLKITRLNVVFVFFIKDCFSCVYRLTLSPVHHVRLSRCYRNGPTTVPYNAWHIGVAAARQSLFLLWLFLCLFTTFPQSWHGQLCGLNEVII